MKKECVLPQCVQQIVCRSSAPLNHNVKVKISNFCHVSEQRVCINWFLMLMLMQY